MPIVSATVDVDAGGRPTAVHATLDLTGITTGNPKRDSDLQKPHLLDTGWRQPRPRHAFRKGDVAMQKNLGWMARLGSDLKRMYVILGANNRKGLLHAQRGRARSRDL